MTTTWHGHRIGLGLSALLTITSVGMAVLAVMLSPDQNAVALPAIAILATYGGFTLVLFHRLKRPIFGELGFIFLGFTTAYSVIPALNFLVLDFKFPVDFDGLNFAVLDPRPAELGRHLWRHALFVFAVAAGYLLVRGSSTFTIRIKTPRADLLVLLSVSLLVLSVSLVGVLSAPVSNYYEHYTRFETLSAPARYAAYVALILKVTSYYLALVVMFSHYQRFKWVIPPFIACLVGYEMIYSFGSRIESLSILLAAVCMYHFFVRPIRLARGALYLAVLLVFFTITEFYRASEFNIEAAVDEFAQRGVKFAYEFGAVFYTSFHIYHERFFGSLPQPESLMLINDFFTAVPLYDHVRYNSQYWYAGIYFPDAVVPPQTMGPLADSGIWGGEIDLAVRGVLTGIAYGGIARWALRPDARWHHMLIYTFLFATSVIGIKYSVIYQISQMARVFLPVLLAYGLYRLLITFSAQRSVPKASPPLDQGGSGSIQAASAPPNLTEP